MPASCADQGQERGRGPGRSGQDTPSQRHWAGRGEPMTVFILGAGVMQIPAIRAAKDLGWTVVAPTPNPARQASGRPTFRPCRPQGPRRFGRRGPRPPLRVGLDGVFTAGTDFSASVAWVAQELGLPGIPFETALKASDKLRMREELAPRGSSPRYMEAGRADDPPSSPRGWPFPWS